MAGLWDIDKIEYVGRTKGLQEGLGFQYYDADKVVAGKKMKDWLRFGVAWWHTFDAPLTDPFGDGTAQRPWDGKYSDPMDNALAKVDYAFEFFTKLGAEYFCFHDRDIAPEGDTPVKVKYGFLLYVPCEILHDGIQLFRPFGIGLEEGIGGNFEFQIK